MKISVDRQAEAVRQGHGIMAWGSGAEISGYWAQCTINITQVLGQEPYINIEERERCRGERVKGVRLANQ